MDRVKYEYKVVIHWKQRDFEEQCAEMLSSAWELHGHPIIHFHDLGSSYAQAFIREVPREGDE